MRVKIKRMYDKIKSVMFGHAVGDALGVPVEFCTREELKENPVTDMQGFGTFPMPKGAWSDDTSMSLCTLESLAKGKIDYNDIMQNFCRWYYNDEFTPTGEMFDVGNTCSFAIHNYHEIGCGFRDCGLNDEWSNGNGSLMRIHPMALYLYTRDEFSVEEKIDIIHKTSALTHAHERSMVACGIYSFVLWRLLKTEKPYKRTVWDGLQDARRFYYAMKKYSEINSYYEMLFRRIANLFRHFEDYETYKPATEDDIKSGGYVVHTLEAAIWCLLNSQSYEACVLTAVNLGGDTDTVAAVAGGLAGALYGYDAIPDKWLNVLLKRNYIEDLCEKAAGTWSDK